MFKFWNPGRRKKKVHLSIVDGRVAYDVTLVVDSTSKEYSRPGLWKGVLTDQSLPTDAVGAYIHIQEALARYCIGIDEHGETLRVTLEHLKLSY